MFLIQVTDDMNDRTFHQLASNYVSVWVGISSATFRGWSTNQRGYEGAASGSYSVMETFEDSFLLLQINWDNAKGAGGLPTSSTRHHRLLLQEGMLTSEDSLTLV